MSMLRATLLATILCIPLHTQDGTAPSRTRSSGIAKLADGKPWSGASIIARESVAAGVEGLDEARTTSDEDGRFALELLEGREYAVWAEAAAGDARVLCSTEAISAPRAGRLELVAADEPRKPRTLTVVGIDAERLAGARASLCEPALSRVQPLVCEGERIRLPARIPVRSLLVLQDRSGVPLLFADLPDDDEDHRVSPGAARWNRVRVLDAPGGRPIAGARILCLHEELQAEMEFELARTDAEGRAVIDLAFGFPTFDDDGADGEQYLAAQLVAVCPGRHLGLIAFESDEPRDAAALAADAGDHLLCHPPEPQSEQKRVVLLADGKPLAGALVKLQATAWNCPEEDSFVGSGQSILRRLGADGALELAGLLDGGDGIAVFLDANLRALLPKGRAEGLATWLELPLPGGGTDSPTIDLVRDLRRVEFRLLAAADKSPVEHATALFATGGHHGTQWLRSDRLGRVRTLLSRASATPFRMGVIDARGWRMVELVPAALAAGGDSALLVDLPLRACSPLRVVPKLPADLDRRESIWFSFSTDSFDGDPEAEQAQPVADGRRGDQQLFLELGPLATVSFASQFPLGGESAEASFLAHLPAIPARWSVSAMLSQGEEFWSGRGELELEGKLTEESFELELERQ